MKNLLQQILTVIFILSFVIDNYSQETISVSPGSRSVGYTSGSTTFTINLYSSKPIEKDKIPNGVAAALWSATSNATWITTVSPSSGSSFPTTVTAYYSANSGAARSGTITFNSSGFGSRTVTVSQAAAPNYLSISPSSISAGYNGTTTYSSASGSWQSPTNLTATPNQSWIHVTNIDLDLKRIYFSVDANSGGSQNGTITVNATNVVSSQTISVSQAAAPPILTVNTTSINIVSTGGTGSIEVSNNGYGTMSWSASSSQSWCTITSGSSGTNTGTINISCTNNTGAARTATITVTASGATGSPKTVTISQTAAPPVLSVSPTTLNVSSTSSNNSVSISNTGYGTLNWTASSNQSWCLLSNNSGSQGDPLTISVTANTSAARSASVTISASGASGSPKTVTINQAAAPNNLSLSSTSFNPGYSGGSTSVTASGSWQTPTGVTTSCSAGWFTASVSGTTITVTASSNSGAARSGTVTVSASNTVGSQTISVNQGAAPNNLSLSPNPISAAYSGATTYSTASGSWQSPTSLTATPNQSWIHVTNIDLDLKRIYFSVDANSGASRNGTITVNASNVASAQTLTINQAAAPNNLSLSPSSISSGYGGTSSSTTYNGSWETPTSLTATSSYSWLHVINIIEETRKVVFSVDANTGDPRTGTIIVSATNCPNQATLTIMQDGSNNLSLNPNPVAVPASGTSTSVTYNGSLQTPTGVTATPNDSWIHFVNVIEETRKIVISIDANTLAARTGTMTINAANVASAQTLTINQEAGPNTLSVSPSSIPVPIAGSTTYVSVTGAWQPPTGITIQISPVDATSWLHVTASGTTVTVVADPNSGIHRNATITVSASNSPGSATISVSQTAPLILDVDPTSFNLSNSSHSKSIDVINRGDGALNWTASSNKTWCLVPNPSGDQDTHVLFNVLANTEEGQRTATITISATNAIGNPKTVTVTQAAAPPYIVCDQSDVQFGGVSVTDNETKGEIIRITNTGYGTATGSVASNSTEFTITPEDNSFSLTHGQYKDIDVTFDPASTGIKSATLSITGISPTNSLTINLGGTGLAGPNLSIESMSPLGGGFGEVGLGLESSINQFRVKNTGDVEINANIYTAPSDEFIVSDGGSKTIPPYNNNLDNTIVVSVVFKPNTAGARSAQLKVDGFAPYTNKTYSMPLSGSGIAPTISVPSSLTFDNTRVNAISPTKVCTLKNTGPGIAIGSVILDGVNKDQFEFVTQDLSFNLNQGAEKIIELRFHPTSAGTKNATLTSDATSNCSFSVPLTGYAIPNVWQPITVTTSTPNIYRQGKVGIGFIGPLTLTEQLEVNGNVKLNTDLIINEKISLHSGTDNNLYINGDGASGASCDSVKVNETAPKLFDVNDGFFRVYSNRVGIGTDPGTNLKFAVGGKMGAREIILSAEKPWPDFVFDKDYQLSELTQLESFISQNGHLPNIENQNDIKIKGQNIAEINVTLLEKVEELTMYLIKIKQKNKEISDRIQLLKIEKP